MAQADGQPDFRALLQAGGRSTAVLLAGIQAPANATAGGGFQENPGLKPPMLPPIEPRRFRRIY